MATRTYIGNAVPIKDVWTTVFANTWATSDTQTHTINGKDLTTTVGSATTTAGVATSVKEAWESTTFTDTTAVASPSGGGTTIGEMAELTATVSGSTVILTADSAGVPHTISSTESTAGSGTASISHTTTATGPAFFDNVDNYAEGSVPTTGDDMILDRPVSMLYALDQNAVTLTSLEFGPGMTSTSYVGLPFRNTTNTPGYEEYREDEFKIGATTTTVRTNSGRIKLNNGSVQGTVNVYQTGNSAETNRRAFQWRGTNASNVVNVFGGDVGIGANGEAATVATLRQTGGTCEVGANVTATTVSKGGGTMILRCGATTVTNDSGTLTLWGAGAITTVNNTGALVDNSSGTKTNVNLYGDGTIDLSGSDIAVTYTNVTVYGRCVIDDPNNRLTITNPPDVKPGASLVIKKWR